VCDVIGAAEMTTPSINELAKSSPEPCGEPHGTVSQLAMPRRKVRCERPRGPPRSSPGAEGKGSRSTQHTPPYIYAPAGSPHAEACECSVNAAALGLDGGGCGLWLGLVVCEITEWPVAVRRGVARGLFTNH
jgi:hypothetical protein